jgi:aspartyl protease family protein
MLYDGGFRHDVVSSVASVSGVKPCAATETGKRSGATIYIGESALGPWIALALLVAGAAYLLIFNDAGVVAGLSHDKIAQLIAGVAVLIFIGSGVIATYRGRAGLAVRHARDWLLFIILLTAVYNYRLELLSFAIRTANDYMPSHIHIPLPIELSEPEPHGPGRTARIKRQWNGHFVAPVAVEGKTIDMLIDTGASTVVLRAEDAKRAGLDITRLNYSVPVQTANGRSFAAPVFLKNVSIGAVSVPGVDALVAKPGSLQTSLLGMSFLSRLRSYEFSGKYLTLRS